MDYKDMLTRYIRLVIDREGTTFFTGMEPDVAYGMGSTVSFSLEELEELERLSCAGE